MKNAPAKSKGIQSNKSIKITKNPEKEYTGSWPIPSWTYVGFLVTGGIFV